MKKGFTLSEILITLGVVGVVAVLTVPSVMKNYRNRMFVAQLQKVHAQINDAAQSIMNDEHVDNFYETSAIGNNVCTKDSNTGETSCSSDGITYFLTKYFKNVKKNCATGTKICIGSSYKNLSGSTVSAPEGICNQTVNGATICGYYDSTKNLISFLVDVNGPAEPNTSGRDVFSMDIKTDGSLSDYGSESNNPDEYGATAENCGTATSSVIEASKGCLTTVIDADWKMEY